MRKDVWTVKVGLTQLKMAALRAGRKASNPPVLYNRFDEFLNCYLDSGQTVYVTAVEHNGKMARLLLIRANTEKEARQKAEEALISIMRGLSMGKKDASLEEKVQRLIDDIFPMDVASGQDDEQNTNANA